MVERRKYTRENGLVLVNYKVHDQQLEAKSAAFDVGGGGVRITTVNRQLEPGNSVEMEIFLPGSSQPILAKGEVVWSDRCKEGAAAKAKEKYFYAGIKFSIIEEDSKNRIVDYVYRKVCRAKRKR